MWQAGATPHHGARASHHRGLSRCGAQAPDAQAQQLWLTGPAAPRHVGSSQTRARTRVPCISRQTPNHCATREALLFSSAFCFSSLFYKSVITAQSWNLEQIRQISEPFVSRGSPCVLWNKAGGKIQRQIVVPWNQIGEEDRPVLTSP